MCDRVHQLPLFPYNRGWEKSTQFRRGLYTHEIRIPVIEGGMGLSPKNATGLTMAHMALKEFSCIESVIPVIRHPGRPSKKMGLFKAVMSVLGCPAGSDGN